VKQPLQRRLMLSLGAFTLGVSALFGLFAMAFVYSVEDRFLERLLEQEAQRQHAHFARQGSWGPTGSEFITLHTQAASLPPELRTLLADEPRRREAAGAQGRHYHVWPLQRPGGPPWLVAEVSQQLIVRPMRQELLGWLLGWGLVMAALSLALARTLARRVSAPLARLAAEVEQGVPSQLPQRLALGTRDDEVGALARAFDALLDRTRAFIGREQAFTRDASHELRTPLTVLRMAIERLQRDTSLPATVEQQLAPMHAATLLMEQTVNTLLLMAREADTPASPVPPTPVLPLVEQWVLAHADWLNAQGLALNLQLPCHAALALPAPVLQLALSSLLGNAVAHGRRGGEVQVSMDAAGLLVRNPSAPLPPGAGEAFVKGQASGGFGLGLAIVRRLLESHGSQFELLHANGETLARIGHPAGPPPTF
jgi:signal transduction histidine kinase